MSIHLQLERPHPAYCRVTFDRPPINAITADTVAELSELVDMIEHDDDPTGARPSRAVTSSHQCIPVGPSGIDRGVVGLIIGILGVRSACCSAAPPSRAPARRSGAGNLAALARRR